MLSRLRRLFKGTQIFMMVMINYDLSAKIIIVIIISVTYKSNENAMPAFGAFSKGTQTFMIVMINYDLSAKIIIIIIISVTYKSTESA
jgi:hypothetical protein